MTWRALVTSAWEAFTNAGQFPIIFPNGLRPFGRVSDSVQRQLSSLSLFLSVRERRGQVLLPFLTIIATHTENLKTQ